MEGKAVRAALKRAAGSVGLEPALDRLYSRVVPSARRAQLDMRHLDMLLAFTLAPDSNCVDVGAHSGAVLREMVRLAPHGRHIAYEPLPGFAAALAGEFPGVDVRQAAASDRAGEVEFRHVIDYPEFSGMRERAYPGEQRVEKLTVRTESLDASLPDGYVPHFLKIDVEGAEQLVLEGAIETIARHRPLIFFEHGAGAAESYGTTPGMLFDLLGGAGMRIFDVDGKGPYSRREFEDVFTRPLWNFLARP